MFIFASNVSVNKIVNFHNDHSLRTFILTQVCYNDYENIQIIAMHNFVLYELTKL